MKVQLATLVLAEGNYLQFKLHLHDDLRDELIRAGRDLRVYLRNSLYAHLKRRFGCVPHFFFVMEEHTVSGNATRPHAHGSIQLLPVSLPMDARKIPLRLRRIILRDGQAAAELAASEELTRQALKAAGGMSTRSRFAATSGLDQSRNLWADEPYGALFNTDWVDYAFKNESRVNQTLTERRLVMPHDLTTEARRLWNLLKEGECALDQWDKR